MPSLRLAHCTTGLARRVLPAAGLALLLAALAPPAPAAAPRRAASQPHAAAAAECRPRESSFFRDEALTVKLAGCHRKVRFG